MRQISNFSAVLPVAAAIFVAASSAHALPMAPLVPGLQQATDGGAPIQIRAGVHRGGAVVRGPRGGTAVVRGGGYHHGGAYRAGAYHGGAYRGGVYRGGRYYGGGAWVRPYRWAPGGAIAAGAAIGVVGAATAAAWASAPPQPGLCWYYTDPSQRNGFWDTCP